MILHLILYYHTILRVGCVRLPSLRVSSQRPAADGQTYMHVLTDLHGDCINLVCLRYSMHISKPLLLCDNTWE